MNIQTSVVTNTSDENIQITKAEALEQFSIWVIHLRWVAGIISSILILFSGYVYDLLPTENIPYLLSLMFVLLALNAFYFYGLNLKNTTEWNLVLQLVFDLILLTIALNLSGGLENPLYLTYIFHGIIGAVILSHQKSLVLLSLIVLLFLALVLGEAYGILPHYSVHFTPHDHGDHASHDLFFVYSRAISFVLILAVSYYFTLVLTNKIKLRETEALRQRALADQERDRLQMLLTTTETELLFFTPELNLMWSNRIASGLEKNAKQGLPEFCDKIILEQVLETRKTIEMESSVVRDGNHLIMRCTAIPLIDQNKSLTRISLLIQDITAIKALESRLEHAGRMRTLGRLVSVVMHEVGNPLASIYTRLERMRTDTGIEFTRKSIDLLEEQVKRIQKIIRSLKDYGTQRKIRWELANINQIIEKILELVKGSSPNIQVVLKFPQKDIVTLCDPDQISQIFWNLISNAIRATASDGKIEIEIKTTDTMFTIIVRDNGPGIPIDQLNKIFEPFYTTEKTGTGLGLSVARTLTEAHGGKITIGNIKSGGAEAIMNIPMIKENR